MLGAQGIRATGFKRAQGNAYCTKFESHTNRVTFETNAIRMTSSVQAHSAISNTLCDILLTKILKFRIRRMINVVIQKRYIVSIRVRDGVPDQLISFT